VDTKKIPDPESVKPEGYDDIPAEIPDPDAETPDDWDEEEDGEWEPSKLPGEPPEAQVTKVIGRCESLIRNGPAKASRTRRPWRRWCS